MVISINIYGSWLISINIYIYILIIYPQVRAGPLRKDFRLKKVSEIIFPGGPWNQIFGNQAYDPRTPSF